MVRVKNNTQFSVNSVLLHEVSIREAMRRCELTPYDIIVDGKIHRFDIDKRGNKAGWYMFQSDGVATWGAFGDWRTGETHTYSNKTNKEMTEGERQLYRERQKKLKLANERERKKVSDKARQKAIWLIDQLKADKTTSYLERKQIKLYGSAGVAKDFLAVPCYIAGNLSGMQFIAGDGSKRFLKHAPMKGAYFVIGELKNADKILIAEGYATAASLHEATELPCIVAFNAGNLAHVGDYWRKQIPNATLIFCADNDENKVGAIKAAEAATKCKGVVRLCPIKGDYNDLFVNKGAEAVRASIFPPAIKIDEKTSVANDEHKANNWYDDWVYINNDDKYYSIKTREKYSTTAFNLECGRYLDDDVNQTASAYVAKNGLVRIVSKAVYAPNIDDVIFEMNNNDCVNTFNKNSLPIPAKITTEQGDKAINDVLFHILAICNKNYEYYEILLNWIAWQVQYRGHKILWCPVIQGVEGIGKSFFGELLAQMLGYENINTVAPNEILSQFNGWAAGACVAVLSEIRIVGQDRYGAANALKPLITDQHIQINIKQVPAHNVINVTNYICMTNYKDAIPISNNDRRWWILYSDYDSIDDFLTKNNANEDYFINLFDNLRTYAPEIHKYFLEFQISDKFKKLKQAPKTDYKDQLLLNEQAKRIGFVEAEDLLKKGGAYFTNEIVCQAEFFNKLKGEYEDMDFKTSNKADFLIRLGFNFFKVMWIDGKARRVYVKNKKLTEGEIREKLSVTFYN